MEPILPRGSDPEVQIDFRRRQHTQKIAINHSGSLPIRVYLSSLLRGMERILLRLG